jgi:hypothetical protein
MSRPKGIKNKNTAGIPPTLVLSTEARLSFLANLIVDRFEQDKKDGYKLLSKMEAK